MDEKQSKVLGKKGGARKGAGRPKGAIDRGNAMIRELIVKALDNLGGTAYLQEVAISHPAAFMSLIGKTMPLQVTGEGGNPVKLEFAWKQNGS